MKCLSQVERLPLKHNEQDQPTWTKFTKNDGKIQVGKKARTMVKKNAQATPLVTRC
jgi:hypothetical protein